MDITYGWEEGENGWIYTKCVVCDSISEVKDVINHGLSKLGSKKLSKTMSRWW